MRLLYVNKSTTKVQINGLNTVINKAVWKLHPPSPPPHSQNITEKEWFIQVKNEEFFHVFVQWDNEKPEFEEVFDRILSTFKLVY